MIPQSAFFRRPWVFVSALLVAGASAAVAAPGWRRAVARPQFVRGFAPEALATDALRDEERTFLEAASEASHLQARLGRLAVAQANSSEVRTFGQQLAADQQLIADAVDALRRKKGMLGEAVAPEVLPEDYQKLSQVAGPDFDREFVRLLSAKHAELMSAFERALEEAKDADVRALAGGYMPTLRAHQNQLTELKKALL